MTISYKTSARIALIFFVALAQIQTAQAADRHRAMRLARQALNNAVKALRQTDGNFGGHRAKALELTEQALREVNEGLKDDKGWF